MILYDLALCIDNNNNEMTFVAPERSEGANDATRATNKLYAPQKSCVYPIYIIPTPTLPFFFAQFFFFFTRKSETLVRRQCMYSIWIDVLNTSSSIAKSSNYRM